MTEDEDSALVSLRERFTAEMTRGVKELAQLGYNATIFSRMLANHGAIEAARLLVLQPTPSEGLWRLQQMGKLDMSVEMWVLLPWYEPLFASDVRDQAEHKLALLGVDVPVERARATRRCEE